MTVGLPPDISYGIQCATELFDITEDVLTYYYSFNEVPLAPLVDAYEFRSDQVGEGLRGLASLYMRPYNDWFWSSGTALERTYCVAGASPSYGRQSAERIDHLVTKYISDMLRDDLDPVSDDHQRQWLDRSDCMSHMSMLSEQLSRKLGSVVVDDVMMAIHDPAEFTLRLPSRADPMSCFATIDDDAEWVDRVGTTCDPPQKTAKRRKTAQRVLKKSSAFLSRLIGGDNVSLFVGGKEIRVEGKRFVFVLKKGQLSAHNHGAVSIAVHERETDLRMFDLCWYVEDTPALDQVAALVMAVRAGDEAEIVRVGNAMRVNYEVINANERMQDLMPTKSDFVMFGGDDDLMLHHTQGTTEYHQSHPAVYETFATSCARRMSNQMPEPLITYFRPHAPQTIRPFIGGRVGRDLLRHDRIELLQV